MTAGVRSMRIQLANPSLNLLAIIVAVWSLGSAKTFPGPRIGLKSVPHTPAEAEFEMQHDKETCELQWNSVSISSQEEGHVNLEVCCNLASLYMAQITNDWQISSPIADFTDISELQTKNLHFSLCKRSVNSLERKQNDSKVSRKMTNSERVDGEEVDECTGTSGVIIELNAIQGFVVDAWYLRCFNYSTLSANQSRPVASNSSHTCNSCAIVHFCPGSDCSKSKTWLTLEVGDVGLKELKLTYHTGNTPFKFAAVTDVHEMPSIGAPKSAATIANRIYRGDKDLSQGTTQSLIVSNLHPGTWYRVSTCAKITVPREFYQSFAFASDIPNVIRKCLEPIDIQTASNQTSQESGGEARGPSVPGNAGGQHSVSNGGRSIVGFVMMVRCSFISALISMIIKTM